MLSPKRPLLTIVIPTRNRGSYLPAVLRTVLEQTYENFEVLVLDNASSDDTSEVLARVSDARVLVHRSESILGMSENWERGLEHARGDYVFYLGADDGLMPGGLQNVAELIVRFAPPALSWQKPDYTWPDATPPSTLKLMLPGPLVSLNASMVLELLCRGWTNYGLLPNIYSSFVRRDLIDQIRERDGAFFASVTPDVYSAIVLASEFKSFLFSPFPFSVSGGSGASNGMANARPGGLRPFFEEAGISMNRRMPVIAGSISAPVLEALLTANERHYGGRLPINYLRYLRLVLSELAERDPEIWSKGVEVLRGLPLTARERRHLESYIDRYTPKTDSSSVSTGTTANVQRDNMVSISDCEALDVHDIYQAAHLVRQLVGDYEVPLATTHLSWAQLASDAVRRGTTRVVSGRRSSDRNLISVLNT